MFWRVVQDRFMAPMDPAAAHAVGNWSLSQDQFLADLRASLTALAGECEAYRLLCEGQGFSAQRDLVAPDDVARIPYLTSNTFKRSGGLFPRLVRIPPEEVDLWTASSSTSGDPSLSGRRWQDVGVYQRAYSAGLIRFCGPEPFDRMLVFWPQPAAIEATRSIYEGKPVEPFALHIIKSEHCTCDPERLHYLLRRNPETRRLEVDLETLVENLREASGAHERVLLIGSTPMLYFTLVEYHQRTGETFDLRPDGYVLAGAGGWDGKKGEVNMGYSIAKEQFVRDMVHILGVPIEHIADRYGFSESSCMLPGHFVPVLQDFVYHTPPWGRVVVRDPFTLQPIEEPAREGLLEVVTPYGMSTHAGVAILVDDLVSLVDPAGCPYCGENGAAIRIHGRAPNSHKAGCGAMIV